MSAFIYFKPGFTHPQVSLELLERWGIAYAFDRLPTVREVHFPGVGRGSVMAEEDRLTTVTEPSRKLTLGYFGEEQIWGRIPKSDCWVGYYKEHKPGERDLARSSRLESWLIRLADGSDWAVPKVADVIEGAPRKNIPCKLDVDDEGHIVPGEPIEQWCYLWELAKPYIDSMMVPNDGDEFDIPTENILADAAKFLQANYRIGLRELLLLELLPAIDWEIAKIPLAAISYHLYLEAVEAQKKTFAREEPTGSGTTAGGPDSTRNSDRPRLIYTH